MPHLNQKTRLIILASVLFVAITGALISFLPRDDAPISAPVAVDPMGVWAQYINMHTSGQISRKAEIQITFLMDVATGDQVGQDASRALEITPSLDGSAVFAGNREIVFRPSEDLPSDRVYTVRLLPKGLESVPDNIAPYDFKISAIRQAFTVAIDNMETDPEKPGVMSLVATLTTADVADDKLVESMVSASLDGKDMALEWRHEPDQRRRTFTIRNLVRQKDSRNLLLGWDGKKIGVPDKGSRDVEIPALGTFQVMNVRTLLEGRQTIVASFSDNLSADQDLSGVISLGGKEFTTRVTGNTLHIYPSSAISGQVELTISKGLRNQSRLNLGADYTHTVFFTSQKPQVRFAGEGVILPANEVISIPFETMNVRQVQVTAFRIFDTNMGQFLQTNKLDGDDELKRVGRYLWRKTISIPNPEVDAWARYQLDATELVRKYPNGMFRLTLSINRGNAIIACSEAEDAVPVKKEKPIANQESEHIIQNSGWDGIEDWYSEEDSDYWNDRKNPCKNTYYTEGENTSSSRNFLASNFGIIAKRGSGKEMHVAVTDLGRAEPIKDIKLEFYNYQNQLLKKASTDAQGMAKVQLDATPFYLVATQGKNKGYLKLSPGSALPVSHFDTGGETVVGGVKGAIYGERGVWRPGDDIHLTFVLHDRNKQIPENHPVTMHLTNPKGQLIQSVVNTKPVNGFYAFTMKTAESDITGNWTASAVLGGSSFKKTIKIEAVKPNRLKLELDFPQDKLSASQMPAEGSLFAQWLHGATAGGLKSEVSVMLKPIPTRFNSFTDFEFDDPVREFHADEQLIFEGKLDSEGRSRIKARIKADRDRAPGRLKAYFDMRVFEPGGDFSISTSSKEFDLFDHYVGMRAPKGDAARNMLLTDTSHKLEIATVDTDGKAVSLSKIRVRLYKLDWKWWWDKSGESLARYASDDHHRPLREGLVSTDKDGTAIWEFEINYPEWGRYLLRACDLKGRHCSGKVIYMDWPGWAGRAAEQSGPGASRLTIFSDKKTYTVGEKAVIQLPKASAGRALVSVETGSKVLKQHWVQLSGAKDPKLELPVTSDMSPTAYVSVTLVQPHGGRDNDRPIRLYGITPLMVEDPNTHLTPVVETGDEWQPKASATVKVSEKNGKPMTYTLAVVDEGLLGLTSFKTPDLHKEFYRREKLGVYTWDLYDFVAGSYSGALERLLALGGGDGEDDAKDKNEERRFPPVVQFFGPFTLNASATAEHKVTLPQYLGAVRVMVVAGDGGGYGSTEKSVYVRESLAMVATVPRVLGPGEQITVPIQLFSTEEKISKATVTVETDDMLSVVGDSSVTISFDKAGDKIGFITLKAADRLGKTRIRLLATAGSHKTNTEVNLQVRSANPATTTVLREVVEPGKSWHDTIKPHGMDGTNHVTVEASIYQPIDLERHLGYLIRYPHGCLEQTTSAIFPQLFLDKLVKLSKDDKGRIDGHVHAALDKLRGFQQANGAFSYWAGQDDVNDWADNYVGNFLVEAKTAGYQIPGDMLQRWLDHQAGVARAWTTGQKASIMNQAYRLYILALAGNGDVAAMNRLLDNSGLDNVSAWLLASAYHLSGMSDVATELTRGRDTSGGSYLLAGNTFGSELRDQAVILNSLLVQGRRAEAKSLQETISEQLSKEKGWYSTQTLSWSLMSLARFSAASGKDGNLKFRFQRGGDKARDISSDLPVHLIRMPEFKVAGEKLSVSNNSDATLFVTTTITGTPRSGAEKESAKGLKMSVTYQDRDGNPINVESLTQGTSFRANIAVTNTGSRVLDNIALTHILPSGWEIQNERFADDGASERKPGDYDYRDIRDDRVLTYFSLKPDQTQNFTLDLTATYPGSYYLPGVQAEAMYDAEIHARSKGRHIQVKSHR